MVKQKKQKMKNKFRELDNAQKQEISNYEKIIKDNAKGTGNITLFNLLNRS